MAAIGPEPLGLNEYSTLAREIAREAAALFEVDRRQVNKLTLHIVRAMLQYAGLTAARERWRPVKQQRPVLNRLRRQLLEVRATIGELSPQHLRAVGNLTGLPADEGAVEMTQISEQLGEIATSVDRVMEFLDPRNGAPPNHGLEDAVRRLLPVFEKLSGETGAVSENKNNSKLPEPRTRSAKALVQTIRQFPSPPSQTAILNMMVSVQRNPECRRYDVEAAILNYFTEQIAAKSLGRDDKPAMGDEPAP